MHLRIEFWVAQLAKLTASDGVRRRECVAPEHVDVRVGQRRQMRDILIVDRVALLSQLIQYYARVNRIPEDDHVGDQAERSKLIFLPFSIALTQLPTLAVKHFTRRAVRASPRSSWMSVARRLTSSSM